MLLGELTASARRLALVGLAKNTGKTVALAALLREAAAAGRTVGVTSVGRDGEEHDVIDFRIEKPAVTLPAGSLVATTDALLSASGLPHELVERSGVRTPLGEVLVVRLRGAGSIEVAGPSASGEVRHVSDAMLGAGAEQVLIDGAIDRRAASSPVVADGLVMSTGAVLSEELEEVVARTAQAVALVRLPTLQADERLPLPDTPESLLVDRAGTAHELPGRFVLTADAPALSQLLRAHPEAQTLLVAGALPERFLADLAGALRRAGRTLTVVVGDPTRAFLSERGIDHYERQGARLRARHAIDLRALTVNPVAPQSHSFDSGELRARLAEAIEDVAIFDVMHPEYLGTQGAVGARRR